MYFLKEITELGKESIYINDSEVCRRIVYNQPSNEDNEGYQLLYSEDFNTLTGLLDFKVELLTQEDTYTLYKDHIDSVTLNGREIDTDNLVEFCVNIMNTQSIPSGMSVNQNSPIEISLYGNNDTIKDFQFIPEKDGTIFHLKDTVIYTNYIVSEKKDRTYSEHPIFYQNNILAKIVYTNNLLINKDYNEPNEVLIFDDANLISDIKYNRVTEFNIDGYKLTRAVPEYVKCRLMVTDKCMPTDTFNINIYTPIDENLSVKSGTTENVIIFYEESHNGRVKEYNILYPIHYISILGNIFVDELYYKIYAEEEIIYENGKLKYHNIAYHRLDKKTLNVLRKFTK